MTRKDEVTLQEVGDKFGVSREAVRLWEKIAVTGKPRVTTKGGQPYQPKVTADAVAIFRQCENFAASWDGKSGR